MRNYSLQMRNEHPLQSIPSEFTPTLVCWSLIRNGITNKPTTAVQAKIEDMMLKNNNVIQRSAVKSEIVRRGKNGKMVRRLSQKLGTEHLFYKVMGSIHGHSDLQVGCANHQAKLRHFWKSQPVPRLPTARSCLVEQHCNRAQTQ